MANRKTGNYTAFGKDVSKRLVDLDMNNTVLAEQLGITSQYLYDILAGTRKATKRKKQIAEIVGLKFENYAGRC